MRKLIAVATIIATGMSLGGTAFAGEVTGSGKGGPKGDGVPGGPTNANSICTFSGLSDGGEGEPAGPGNPPQNWGQIPKEVREFLASIGEHPGQACNGNRNPWKG